MGASGLRLTPCQTLPDLIYKSMPINFCRDRLQVSKVRMLVDPNNPMSIAHPLISFAIWNDRVFPLLDRAVSRQPWEGLKIRGCSKSERLVPHLEI